MATLSKLTEIASREIDVNGQRTDDRLTGDLETQCLCRLLLNPSMSETCASSVRTALSCWDLFPQTIFV